jgi:hypothetical protein
MPTIKGLGTAYASELLPGLARARKLVSVVLLVQGR